MTQPSISSTAPETRRAGALLWTAALAVSALPAGLTWALVRFWMRSDLAHYVPSAWNDMTDYWHETLSFLRAGLNSGIYGVNELGTAPLSMFHFDAHGPFYPLFFGTLARITGWDYPAGIYINMLILALGVLAFFVIIRARLPQVLGTAGVMLAVFPVVMYVPTHSQEPFHQAGAFVAAGVFYRLLRFRGENPQVVPPLRLAFPAFLFLFFMMCVRLSWGLLLVPFFALTMPRTRRAQIMGLIAALLCLLGGYFVMWAVSPPQGSNHTVLLIVEGLKQSLTAGLQVIQTLVNYNLMYALEWPTTVNITLFVICTLASLTLIAWLLLLSSGKPLRWWTGGEADELLFHIYNLVAVLGMTFTVYLLENAARVLGIHLLITLLVMLAFGQRRFLAVTVVFCLLLTPWNLDDYRTTWKGNFDKDGRAIDAMRAELSELAGYDEHAPSPWCNSVFIPLDMYDYRALVVPPGIGIQFYLRRIPLELPLKSGYLYMDEPNLRLLQEKKGKIPLEVIRETPFGTYYRNMDADCDHGT